MTLPDIPDCIGPLPQFFFDGNHYGALRVELKSDKANHVVWLLGSFGDAAGNWHAMLFCSLN